VNETEAIRIAARFGIAGSVATELTGGYSNDVWRVEAEGARYVVRRYGRLHVSRAAILFEHAILAHIAPRMTEVVAPLSAADGSTLLADDGRFVALFPYVEGTTGARDVHAADQAADVLARFHRAGTDIHIAGGLRSVLARFHRAGTDIHIAGGLRSSRTVGMLAWLREMFVRFAARADLAQRLPWAALIAAVGGAVTRVAPHAARLPHAIVHGDPHPDNFVRDDERVRALIDFDFAHESERVYDVATAADAYARENEDGLLDYDRLAAFVSAYDRSAPLVAIERELLADEMIRRNATLVWYVVSRHGERTPGDIGGAPRYAARVTEIANAYETIKSYVSR